MRKRAVKVPVPKPPKLTPTLEDKPPFTEPASAPIGGQVRFINPIGDPLRPKKVAIVGTQPSSRMLAPFGDPSYTIWGTSPGNMNLLPRVDAWFEMHCNFLWPQYKAAYGEAYVNWVNSLKIPVVAQDQKLFKNAISYPIFEMIKKFGPYFFTSTFAYCMAWAIDVGVEELSLYGVDMSSKGEYITQRPGGHYFLQVAQQRGITVVLPQESDLAMPPPLYGYSDASDYGRKQATRRFEVAERVSQLEQQIASGNQQVAYLKGAAEDIDYNETVYGSVEQLAVYKFLLQEEQRKRKSEMPFVQAPPLVPAGETTPGPDEAPGPDLRPRVPGKRHDPIAGLELETVLKPMFGDAFPTKTPVKTKKRKRVEAK